MTSYGKEKVVCTICGAKGNEPCIGQITGNKMPIKHAPRFQKPLGAKTPLKLTGQAQLPLKGGKS